MQKAIFLTFVTIVHYSQSMGEISQYCSKPDQLVKNLTNNQDLEIDVEKLYIDSNDELGKGAFGIVKKISWPGLDKKVAVKKVEIKTNSSTQDLEKEIWALKKMNKYDITPQFIACINQNDKTFYFVQELVDGWPLDNLIKKETNKDYDYTKGIREDDVWRKLSLLEGREVLEFWVKAFWALNVMYKENVVHNDIKMANMMITKDWTHLYLIDLGFAEAPSDGKGARKGSPLMMAPGRHRRGPYRNIDDLYSLVITIANSFQNSTLLRSYRSVELEKGQKVTKVKILSDDCFLEERSSFCKYTMADNLKKLFTSKGLGEYQPEYESKQGEQQKRNMDNQKPGLTENKVLEVHKTQSEVSEQGTPDLTKMSLTTLFLLIYEYENLKMSFEDIISVISHRAQEWGIKEPIVQERSDIKIDEIKKSSAPSVQEKLKFTESAEKNQLKTLTKNIPASTDRVQSEKQATSQPQEAKQAQSLPKTTEQLKSNHVSAQKSDLDKLPVVTQKAQNSSKTTVSKAQRQSSASIKQNQGNQRIIVDAQSDKAQIKPGNPKVAQKEANIKSKESKEIPQRLRDPKGHSHPSSIPGKAGKDPSAHAKEKIVGKTKRNPYLQAQPKVKTGHNVTKNTVKNKVSAPIPSKSKIII